MQGHAQHAHPADAWVEGYGQFVLPAATHW